MPCPHCGTHMIPRLRSHQGDLVVATPKQSPDGIELPLDRTKETRVNSWTKHPRSVPVKLDVLSPG